MILLRDYALSFVGLPYVWGGDDPMRGFDCSGLSQELLASAGEVFGKDMRAQDLFDWYCQKGSMNTWGLGSLAFFGKSATQIAHVGFCLDTYRMLEAGGGGPRTVTVDDAVAQNAYVRIRLIKNRKDLVGVIRPRYVGIGCI